MSVQEIKDILVALPRKEQDEVVAFLFHLRHQDDPDYQCDVARRLDDKDPSHWLSPEEFERKTRQKRKLLVGAYSVYLLLELLEFVPSRGKQRSLIMSFVRLLGENPDTLGDFTDQDDTLRI